jgi:hypothetical protein
MSSLLRLLLISTFSITLLVACGDNESKIEQELESAQPQAEAIASEAKDAAEDAVKAAKEAAAAAEEQAAETADAAKAAVEDK